MTDNSLTIIDQSDAMFDIHAFERRLQAIDQRDKIFTAIVKRLESGVDFGKAFGDSKKDVLLKVGSETICSLLGLRHETSVIEVNRDFTRMLFDYTVRVELIEIASGVLVATGVGSSNSYETKHRRWVDAREAERRGLTLETLKSKTYDNSGKTVYSVPMDDSVIDNTILKMAEKRAKVNAVLSLGFSRYFTQDLEDFQQEERQPSGNRKQPQTETSTADDTKPDWTKFYHWAFQTHMLDKSQVDKALGDINRGTATKQQIKALVEQYVAAAASAPPAQPKEAPQKLPDAPPANEQTERITTLLAKYGNDAFGMDLEVADFIDQHAEGYSDMELLVALDSYTVDNTEWDADTLTAWLDSHRPAVKPTRKMGKK